MPRKRKTLPAPAPKKPRYRLTAPLRAVHLAFIGDVPAGLVYQEEHDAWRVAALNRPALEMYFPSEKAAKDFARSYFTTGKAPD